MPYKKYTKRRKTNVKKRKTNRKINMGHVVWKNKNYNPVPKQLSDSFALEWEGQIPASTLLAGGFYHGIGLNNINPGNGYGPFYAVPTSTSWTNTAVFKLVGSTISTATQPTGMAVFYSGNTGLTSLYQKAVVTGVSYKVIYQPVNSADTLLLAVVPENVTSTSSGSQYVDINEARQSPYAKSRVCYGNNTSSGNTLKGYIDIARFMGISRKELVSNPMFANYCSTNGPVGPTTTQGQFASLFFWAATLDNAQNGSVINVSVKLKYYVTFLETQTKLLSN